MGKSYTLRLNVIQKQCQSDLLQKQLDIKSYLLEMKGKFTKKIDGTKLGEEAIKVALQGSLLEKWTEQWNEATDRKPGLISCNYFRHSFSVILFENSFIINDTGPGLFLNQVEEGKVFFTIYRIVPGSKEIGCVKTALLADFAQLTINKPEGKAATDLLELMFSSDTLTKESRLEMPFSMPTGGYCAFYSVWYSLKIIDACLNIDQMHPDITRTKFALLEFQIIRSSLSILLDKKGDLLLVLALRNRLLLLEDLYPDLYPDVPKDLDVDSGSGDSGSADPLYGLIRIEEG